MNIFEKKKKKREFISEGQSPEVNKHGTTLEFIYTLIKLIFLGVFFVCGAIICYMDIRDEGSMIEFSMGSMTCKYVASSVGAIIMIVAILVFASIKPKVYIK